MKLRLLPEAEKDIGEIAIYIAYDDKTAALRCVGAIDRKCSKLVDTPSLGVARDDIAPGLRMLPSGNYIILYRQSGDLIEIVRVLDGRRRWQTLL